MPFSQQFNDIMDQEGNPVHAQELNIPTSDPNDYRSCHEVRFPYQNQTTPLESLVPHEPDEAVELQRQKRPWIRKEQKQDQSQSSVHA